MSDADRIELAHEEPFRLGPLTVRPALREVVRDDGDRETLEPRVMQVLAFLRHSDGAIVTRDELIEACWDGRIVGDDAINRVIARLRRLGEGLGRGSFGIETITKVGYRLAVAGDAPPVALTQPSAVPDRPPGPPALSRRVLVGGGVAAALGAGVAGGLVWRRHAAPPPAPSPAAALLVLGETAVRQATPDGGTQAIGLFRRAVELEPRNADAWGALASGYAAATHGLRGPQLAAVKARAEAAIGRANMLDPGNPTAAAAAATLLPRMGQWQAGERLLAPALQRQPRNSFVLFAQAQNLYAVGRCNDAAAAYERIAAVTVPSPAVLYRHVLVLWSCGRLEEADALMAKGAALFPLHFAVWFTHFYLLLYTGRADEALAMSANIDARPIGVPASNFDIVAAVARAVLSGARADVDRAIAINLAAARTGAGFAENTMQFAAFLGRVDDAFMVAEGYYLGRGFPVAERRFTAEQGNFTRLDDRHTYFLFQPSAAAMRRDPHFAGLTRAVGLDAYWAATGPPDFRRRAASA